MDSVVILSGGFLLWLVNSIRLDTMRYKITELEKSNLELRRAVEKLVREIERRNNVRRR